MNDLITKENIKIENMIYEVRGKQVMLASDVAKLYQTETKRVNEVIKRNQKRFPKDFCFQLTPIEKEKFLLRSQIATSSEERNNRIHGGTRYLPYVLTEQGIMMLSGLLKSDVAVEMNIKIINAFVAMRKYVSNSLTEYNQMLINHENRISLLENAFNKFKEKDNHIFFEGQIYDAYSLMLEIFDKASKEIIIIDNYIDKNILDIIANTTKEVMLITNTFNNIDYYKYKKQYSNVNLVINNSFHDRFIILDRKMLYHSGASFKDLGKKCFAITKIESEEILKSLLNKIY